MRSYLRVFQFPFVFLAILIGKDPVYFTVRKDPNNYIFKAVNIYKTEKGLIYETISNQSWTEDEIYICTKIK